MLRTVVFQQLLPDGVAELADQAHAVVPVQCQDSHPARMVDDLPVRRFPVGQLHLVHVDPDDPALKDRLAAYRSLGQLHVLSSFRPLPGPI